MDPHTTTLGDLRQIAQQRGSKGRVATNDAGLVHWSRSALAGRSGAPTGWNERVMKDEPVPASMVAKMMEGLPALRRRTPQERLESMTRNLVTQVQQVYAKTGRFEMPTSLVDDICRVYALEMGKIISPDSVRRMTFKEVLPLLEAKVKRDFTRAGHLQADKDQHKVTRDWHGHGNHQISTAR